MTLPIDETTLLGALRSAVKNYPGGARQLASDMDMPESTLYAKLRGEKGYPLSFQDGGELEDILGLLRSRDADGWQRVIHVFCHRHDHLAIPIPRALKEADGEGLRQAGQMMQDVTELIQAMSDALDERQANGRDINSKEMKRIDAACDEAMEKIAEIRAWCRKEHETAKKDGRVK